MIFFYRILFNEELKNSSVGIADALAFSQFRVSKLAQNMTPPNGVYQIKSLVNVNLSKVVFKNQTKPQSNNDVKTLNLNDKSNLAIIIIDVQLMHSQGERSEIVQITAKSLQDESIQFEVNCRGVQEDFLANDVRYIPVSQGLANFASWLKQNFPDKFIGNLIFLFFFCVFKYSIFSRFSRFSTFSCFPCS